MSRRTIAILIFVVGIILLSIVGVLFILQQDQPPVVEEPEPYPGAEETPAPDGAIPGEGEPVGTVGAMVEVVVSLQTVPRGWQMTEAELTTDMRLVEEVGTNVLTNVEDAVGLYARTDIFQGQTLTRDMLVGDPTLIALETFGPSSLIPPGFVAQAVPMNRLSGVANGLAEGDYVDILITVVFYQIDEQFQSYLENTALFFLEEAVAAENQPVEEGEDAEAVPAPFTIPQFGRFEELATGDLAHIGPSEFQRPVPVAMIIQNAKVIQVGPYLPQEAEGAQLPTPSPEPLTEDEPTATPTPAAAATLVPTPLPPASLILLALQPQQQLLLKYALEVDAQIHFALRGVNDTQLYTVDNVDLEFLLERFNVEVPPNFGYTLETAPNATTEAPTPVPEGTAPEG